MNANGRIHEGEMPSGESSSTETIRLVGRGFKIPIRSLPTAQGIVTNYLYAGDTIVVKISDSKNFYRLADDSGFINKNLSKGSWKVVESITDVNSEQFDSLSAATTTSELLNASTNATIPQNESVNEKILGIKFSYFEAFMEENGGREAFEGKSTGEVNANIMTPLCQSLHNISVCQSLSTKGSEYVGKPTWFISHAWSYNFLDVIEAVKLTLRRTEGEDKYRDTVVWFDQFTLVHPAPPSLPYETLHDTFMNSTRAIGKMMLVFDKWDNPTHLTRAWCVFEVYASLSTESPLEVALTQSENDRFLEAVRWDYQSFYQMLTRIDSSKSIARYDEDREKIHRAIRDKINGGFITLDRAIFNELEKWMINIMQNQIIQNSDEYEKGAWQQALANVFVKMAQPDKAEVLFTESVEIMKKVLGDDHQDTLTAICNLALFYESIGRYVEAEELSISCLEATRRVMGDEHPDTLSSINNLAYLYEGQKKFDLAEPLSLQCVEIRTRVNGKDDPLTIISMINLGSLYYAQEKYDKAEPIFIDCYELNRQVLGINHPDTLISMSILAACYQSLKKYELAEPLFQETLTSRRRLLGNNHPSTQSSMSALAGLYEAIGGDKVALAIPLRDELKALQNNN